MYLRKILLLAMLTSLYGCSLAEPRQSYYMPPITDANPYRDKSIGFLSRISNVARHIGDQTYNVVFSIRDEIDNLVYEVDKSYYDNYGDY